MLLRVLMVVLALAVPLRPAPMPFAATRTAMRSMGTEEGLPSSRVHATLKDHLGRLWVGTQNGAAYLGGSGWTAFPLPREARSNYIRALAEAADGSLWFGTEAGGLWRWRNGVWRHWLPAARINALHADGAILWVGTAGQGLMKIEEDQVAAVPGPTEPWIWTLAAIRDGSGQPRLWVGGEKQVWVLEAAGWRQMGAREGWWQGGANCLAERRGPGGALEVWVGCWGLGVGRWDPVRRQFQGPLADFPSHNPTCLTLGRRRDGEDDLWVGTYDAGLVRRTATGWAPLGPEQGFPGTSVYSLLGNPEGRPDFWAGTRGAGLVAVDGAGWRTLPRDPHFTGKQTNCFLETRDARGGPVFWFGTDNGLVRWDARGAKVETSAQGLPGNFITSLLERETPQGPELWAATVGGLARRRNGRWEAFGRAQGLTFYRVQCLAADVDDADHPRLFAGADGGLVCYQDGVWSQYGLKEGLPHNIVETILASKDQDGHACLWVGTRGGGLGRLSQGRWQVFGAKEGLPSASVYGLATSLAPSGKRWLWVTVLGAGGLARLDQDHPERGLQSWSPQVLAGLGALGIESIVASPQGLYLTSTSGVVQVQLAGADADPAKVLRFTPSDGLPSLATSGIPYLDREGRVWVGTTKGIAVLDPTLEQEPGAPPRPLVESVAVQGRPIDFTAPIRLGFRDRRLTVGFFLPSFHRHEAIRYRTQLLGLENEPQEWSNRAEREFTTLPPRRYVLRIWGKDGLGQTSPPLDLPFTVAPPPWFTPWALILEGLALGGLIYLVVYRRQRTLRRRTLDLERLVLERTRELATANDALFTRSQTDPLTGLANRRALDDAMGDLVSRFLRNHQPGVPGNRNQDLAFLILDLDHFKAVNDTHGHRAGDLVLQGVARILRQTVRETDRLVRWGGEEFVVVAVDTDREEIPALAERLRAAVAAQPCAIGGGQTLPLTLSVGFTCLPLFEADPAGVNWEQAVNLADQCLYQAKQAGRNRWVGLLARPEVDPAQAAQAGLEVTALAAGGWVDLRQGPQVP